MISFYLNSLYNLLYKNNPLIILYLQITEGAQTILHVPQNRKLVGARISRLEARAHSVEGYILQGQPNARRLNMYR